MLEYAHRNRDGGHFLYFTVTCAVIGVVSCAVLPEKSKTQALIHIANEQDLPKQVQRFGAESPGHRAWAGRRCSDHFSEVKPFGGADVSNCLKACRAHERCAKTSLHINTNSSCYLFDDKARCTTSPGWTTVFRDRRCGHVENGRVIELACPIGSYISNVAFASYGTPTGTCSDLTVNSSCHVNSSLEIVSDLCVGERECNVAASSEVFGDSCSSENQSLGVRVECTVGKDFNEDTYFNAWSARYWDSAVAEIDTRVEEWSSFLKTLPDYPEGRFSGRGIIVVAGGRYLEPALVMIKMLRNLGCTLRIQVWHLGKHEMAAEHLELLAPYDVETRDFEDYVGPEALQPIAANVGLRLFQLKPLALLHSDLEEVLLLDSDNCPIRDPAYLFDDPGFRSVGTAFWPDFWKTSAQNPIWQIIGANAETSGWEQESGQLLLRKSASWNAINLAVHLNSDFYMKLLNGDKDTFRFSWYAAGVPFIMIPTLPTPVGTLKELHTSDSGFCGHTMLQHDFNGRALFVHHNQLKSGLLKEGENFKYAKSSTSVAHKAVPVLGLQLPNRTVLPCIDMQGDGDPNIDEATTYVYDSGLSTFERQYFAAKKSIPSGLFSQLKEMPTLLNMKAAQAKTINHHLKNEEAVEKASLRIRRDANTTCTSNQFELSAPTISMDRVCESLTLCGADQIEVSVPTTISDRECRRKNIAEPTQIHVRVAKKMTNHPFFGTGSLSNYELRRGRGNSDFAVVSDLHLTNLHTYEFIMHEIPPEYPFILTLDAAGGWSSSPYTAGVTGSEATGNETLSFTPSYSSPNRLYYQSHRESFVGGQITVTEATYGTGVPGQRFSTAYSPSARLFELSAPGEFNGLIEQVLRESCQRSCGIRADCEGIFIFELETDVICYGLSDISGPQTPTDLESLSIKKLIASS